MLDRFTELLIEDIELVELDPTSSTRLGQIVQVTDREIVNDEHVPAFIHQTAGEVRTNEPCAARDEGSAIHLRMLLARTKRYFTRAPMAGNPSRQEIFFPSSTSRPVYRTGTS